MSKTTPSKLPEAIAGLQDALSEMLRKGAKSLLMSALEIEVEEYLKPFAGERDEHGKRLVVRNGYARPREVLTGLGRVPVRAPRVDDRRVDSAGIRIRFTSRILPPYLRRAQSVDELIPWLYLKGISSGDFPEALAALFGSDAPGLSASTVVRLKKLWEDDHAEWSHRSLKGKRYVYIWADGVYFNIRLEGERSCILVVMGATVDGKKELIAVHDGRRESELSWMEILLNLKDRELELDPKVAVGDGALGFWSALEKIFPETRIQRCWVHKMANVLNALPKSLHVNAKAALHEIWMAPTKEQANKAFDRFIATYGAKYPKAVQSLVKDRDSLLTFYDFPAEHWIHLRTTNPIESTFATVRLRTSRTKGCGSRMATLTMVFKLAQSAERSWRRLNGHQLLGELIAGIRFKDGIREHAA